MRWLAVLPVLALAACATDSPPPPQTAPTTVVCLPVTLWTKPQELALANALQPISEDSPIWAMARDWTKIRAAAKACIASKPK